MKVAAAFLFGLLLGGQVLAEPAAPAYLTGAEFHLYGRRYATPSIIKDGYSASLNVSGHTDSAVITGDASVARTQAWAFSSGVLGSYTTLESSAALAGTALDVFSYAILGDSIRGPVGDFGVSPTQVKLAVDGLYTGTLLDGGVTASFDVFVLAPGGLAAFADYYNDPTKENEAKAYSHQISKQSAGFSSSTGDLTARNLKGFKTLELYAPQEYDLMVKFVVFSTVKRPVKASDLSQVTADFSTAGRVSLFNPDGLVFSASGLLPGTLPMSVPEPDELFLALAGVAVLMFRLRAVRPVA